MTVHIGEITSEIRGGGPPAGGTETPDRAPSAWEERARLADLLDRVERDSRRTATGDPDG